MADFKSLNLAAPLNEALDELGYTTPTPIQLQAIPDVLKGRDLMGIAQTGTGKTAAFSLPLLNHLCLNDHEPPKKGARALILAPTRELASQIAVSIEDYGRKMDFLSVTTVFGGASITRQIKRLSGGNDIIVATPGRLIDLLERKSVTLRDVEVLILDEADQMMDMGFIHALKKIVPLLPKKRQTLFFSATMVPKIKKLAGQFLTDPVTVSVTPANSTAERVEQRVTFATPAQKQNLLSLSLLDPEVDRALVFTRTKHGADRVSKRLAQVGLASMAIHGNKSQGQRQFALSQFREGKIKILVATDVAARGIDIEGITHVFNYEIPNVPEQYVHRIGRTARANRSGIAHAFVAKDERSYLKDIQRLLKTTIPVVELPEDFESQSRLLKTREPIPMPDKPKPETRKGRGKSSKKKARFSKDREKKSNVGRSDNNDAPRRNKKPHRGQGNADAQSKQQNTESQGQTKSQNQSEPKRFAKKGDNDYRGRKPKSENKSSDNRDSRGNDSWDRKRSDERGPKRNDSWDKKRSDNRGGDKRRNDRGPKAGQKSAARGEENNFGKNKDSRAARKAVNQARHAEQHSRRKPREGDKADGGKPSGKTFGKKPYSKDGAKPAAKKPHQQYGKRRGPNKSSGKPVPKR